MPEVYIFRTALDEQLSYQNRRIQIPSLCSQPRLSEVDPTARTVWQRDTASSYLSLEPDDDDAMAQLQGHSITYRMAVARSRAGKSSRYRRCPLMRTAQAVQ